MSAVSPRTARLVALVGVPAALVASGVLVSTASYSAFSATTTNPTSNWTAGTVALSDDDGGAALFTATNLRPGSTGQNCIAVTSTGSLPSTVKLYASGAVAQTKDLATNLQLTVEQGTGGGSGTCSGFTPAATVSGVYSGSLAGVGSATSYATGLGRWATTGAASETQTYRFTWTLPTTTPNSVQGGTASVGFTWEAQNNE